MNLTRRQILSHLAAASGISLVPQQLLALSEWSRLPVEIGGNHSSPNGAAVPLKVQPFPMTAVRLRPGLFQEAMAVNTRYLFSLPNDRLLHLFRVRAGLPSSAEPLMGWENPDMHFRGHFSGGHYLSACALTYASTRDEALKVKANELVIELAKCQATDGYLGLLPLDVFENLFDKDLLDCPFYIYHKIMAGHLDMYLHCDNQQALATLERMAQWVEKFVQPLSEEKWQVALSHETGGMKDVLASLYAITQKTQYLTLARRFDHQAFFGPLAEHRDALKGLHGNASVPKVIGAARDYEVTGEAHYRDIAEYFWHDVTTQRCYCTGGTTGGGEPYGRPNGEYWNTEPGQLAATLGPDTGECCVAHNMLKLTRHLFGWSADATLMDYYERTLFNHRLGTQDPNGMLMYYFPLMPGAWKTFNGPNNSFWCCTGTGVEEFAKTGDTIYYHDDKNLYVNLFIASEVNWAEKKLRLVQETTFPNEAHTRLTVHCASPVKVGVKIRVPYWADAGVTLTVNGKPQKIVAKPSTYLSIDRQWHDGDTVDVEIPMRLHVDPLLGDHTLQAMMYGPLVLAGRLGPVDGDVINDGEQPVRGFPEFPMPEIINPSKDATAWVEPVPGEPLQFRTVGQAKNIALIPVYKSYKERYIVYWKVKPQAAP